MELYKSEVAGHNLRQTHGHINFRIRFLEYLNMKRYVIYHVIFLLYIYVHVYSTTEYY